MPRVHRCAGREAFGRHGQGRGRAQPEGPRAACRRPHRAPHTLVGNTHVKEGGKRCARGAPTAGRQASREARVYTISSSKPLPGRPRPSAHPLRPCCTNVLRLYRRSAAVLQGPEPGGCGRQAGPARPHRGGLPLQVGHQSACMRAPLHTHAHSARLARQRVPAGAAGADAHATASSPVPTYVCLLLHWRTRWACMHALCATHEGSAICPYAGSHAGC